MARIRMKRHCSTRSAGCSARRSRSIAGSGSGQAHENARELIGLVEHDVMSAINDPRFPRRVTSNPFEGRCESRKLLCADISLAGDPLVSTRELDLLGEAGGRLRRHLAVDPGSISLIDG